MIRLRRQVERELPPITAASRTGPFPLSPLQERLWRHDLSPGRPATAYNVTVVRRLRGPVDRRALRGAALGLAERHEALRTVFPAAGDPVQHVLNGCEPQISFAEGGDLTTPAGGQDAAAWVSAEAARRFDLAEGPLFRLALLRTGPEEHLMFLAAHHIVSDGWSAYLLLSDLAGLYAARTGQATAEPPPPRFHLGDFVAWQHACMRSAVLESYLRFGQGQLPPEAADPPLPPDLTPSPAVRLRGARVHFTVPAKVTRCLRAVAEQRRITMLSVLLAAYAVLLSRRCGREAVCAGIPAANRGLREFSGTVGLLINILPVRVEADDTLTVAELASRVHSVLATAFAYQAMPLERLVRDLYPGDEARADNPLSTFFAVYRGGDRNGPPLPGTTSEPYPIEVKDTHYPLAMTLTEHGDRLSGRLAYSSGLYLESTAHRLADEYRSALALLASNPSMPVGRLKDTLPPAHV